MRGTTKTEKMDKAAYWCRFKSNDLKRRRTAFADRVVTTDKI